MFVFLTTMILGLVIDSVIIRSMIEFWNRFFETKDARCIFRFYLLSVPLGMTIGLAVVTYFEMVYS